MAHLVVLLRERWGHRDADRLAADGDSVFGRAADCVLVLLRKSGAAGVGSIEIRTRSKYCNAQWRDRSRQRRRRHRQSESIAHGWVERIDDLVVLVAEGDVARLVDLNATRETNRIDVTEVRNARSAATAGDEPERRLVAAVQAVDVELAFAVEFGKHYAREVERRIGDGGAALRTTLRVQHNVAGVDAALGGVADVCDRDDTGTGDSDVRRKLVGVVNRHLGRSSVGGRI